MQPEMIKSHDVLHLADGFNITAHFLFFPLLILIKLNYPVEVNNVKTLEVKAGSLQLKTLKEKNPMIYLCLYNKHKIVLLFENDYHLYTIYICSSSFKFMLKVVHVVFYKFLQ